MQKNEDQRVRNQAPHRCSPCKRDSKTQDGLDYIELRNLKAIQIHLKGNLVPFKLAYVSSKNCLWMSDIEKNAVWKVIIKGRTVHKILQAQFISHTLSS